MSFSGRRRSASAPSFRTTGLACAAGVLLTFATACGSASPAGTGGTSGAAASGSANAGGNSAAPVCKAASDSICMTLGDNPVANGLTQEQTGGTTGDSEYHTATTGGRPSFVFDTNSADGTNPVSYIYFQADSSSSILKDSPSTLYMTVTYYDDPAGLQLYTEYDSTDTSAPVNGAYKSVATKITTTGTKSWKSVTWSLPEVNFQQGENGSSDFRLDGAPGVAVGSVVVSLKPPAGAKPQ